MLAAKWHNDIADKIVAKSMNKMIFFPLSMHLDRIKVNSVRLNTIMDYVIHSSKRGNNKLWLKGQSLTSSKIKKDSQVETINQARTGNTTRTYANYSVNGKKERRATKNTSIEHARQTSENATIIFQLLHLKLRTVSRTIYTTTKTSQRSTQGTTNHVEKEV